jgi:hypothetical protein
MLSRVSDKHDSVLTNHGELSAALQAKIAKRDAIGRADVPFDSPHHIFTRSDSDICKWWKLQSEIRVLEKAVTAARAEMLPSLS